MACFFARFRLLLALIAICGTSACGRFGQTSEQTQIVRAFDAWKTAMINRQTDQAVTYISHHVDDYLSALNLGATNSAAANAPPSSSPGVDLLLRTAMQKKVPADLRSHLTFDSLAQRISDRNLFNPRDVQEIDLGHIFVTGDRATAEVYYHGALTSLRLPFIKENGAWKIDVMALLQSAEVLMRIDRAWKGETEMQQVDQLVSKLPSL